MATGIAVAGGVVIWTLFAVQDAALTGLGKARWLPIENGLAGIAKLALLPLCVGMMLGLLWASLVPALIAVLVMLPLLNRLTRPSGPTSGRHRHAGGSAARGRHGRTGPTIASGVSTASRSGSTGREAPATARQAQHQLRRLVLRTTASSRSRSVR